MVIVVLIVLCILLFIISLVLFLFSKHLAKELYEQENKNRLLVADKNKYLNIANLHFNTINQKEDQIKKLKEAQLKQLDSLSPDQLAQLFKALPVNKKRKLKRKIEAAQEKEKQTLSAPSDNLDIF